MLSMPDLNTFLFVWTSVASEGHSKLTQMDILLPINEIHYSVFSFRERDSGFSIMRTQIRWAITIAATALRLEEREKVV